MASSPAMKFSLLLLFTLLSYPLTQARDSQLFNKVSSSSSSGGGAATTVVPDQDSPLKNNQQEQEPSFFPQDKENGYGLYGHESGQATGAAAESEDNPNSHLPRNYNSVAYLTESEEDTDENDNDSDNDNEDSYTTTLQNYYNDIRKSKKNQQEDEEILREPESSYNNNNNQYRYRGGSSFNSDAAAGNSRENYVYNGGEEESGMSDTRFLENGKYFYDIKTEKYSRNHPYSVLNRAGAANNINYNDQSNYYGANDNSMSTQSYQNQYEFQNQGN